MEEKTGMSSKVTPKWKLKKIVKIPKNVKFNDNVSYVDDAKNSYLSKNEEEEVIKNITANEDNRKGNNTENPVTWREDEDQKLFEHLLKKYNEKNPSTTIEFTDKDAASKNATEQFLKCVNTIIKKKIKLDKELCVCEKKSTSSSSSSSITNIENTQAPIIKSILAFQNFREKQNHEIIKTFLNDYSNINNQKTSLNTIILKELQKNTNSIREPTTGSLNLNTLNSNFNSAATAAAVVVNPAFV